MLVLLPYGYFIKGAFMVKKKTKTSNGSSQGEDASNAQLAVVSAMISVSRSSSPSASTREMTSKKRLQKEFLKELGYQK